MSGIGKLRGHQPSPRLKVKTTPVWHTAVDDHVIALAWSPDSRWLAVAEVSGPIRVFAGATGQLQAQMTGHTLGTTAIDWHPQQPLLASSGQDGTTRVWDACNGNVQHTLSAPAGWGERVAWSPHGDLLASSAGRTIRLWNSAGQLLHDWADHASTVSDMQWQPGGRLLAAVAYGGVTLWSPDQSLPTRRYQWQGSTLTLAWSPDSTFIATGDQDSTVHFWYVQSGVDLQMWGYETKVLELSWHYSSRYLATGGGATPCVWDCAGPQGPEGTRPVQLQAHAQPVRALAYQHAGSLLASGGREGGVGLWQPDRTHKLLTWIDGYPGVTQLAWSADDQRLAVGREDGTVDVYAIKGA